MDRQQLAELGQRFAANWCGRHTGHLQNFLNEVVLEMRAEGTALTFAELLFYLELRVARHQIRGVQDSPVVEVDRVAQTLTHSHPKTGELRDISFRTLRNKLTIAKKF